MSTIVTFGQYKGKSLYEALRDINYVNYCKKNGIYEKLISCENTRNLSITNIFTSSVSIDSPTPVHNKMQNKFLDKTFICDFLQLFSSFKSLQSLLNSKLYKKMFYDFSISSMFEPIFETEEGWDVRLRQCGITIERKESFETLFQKHNIEYFGNDISFLQHKSKIEKVHQNMDDLAKELSVKKLPKYPVYSTFAFQVKRDYISKMDKMFRERKFFLRMYPILSSIINEKNNNCDYHTQFDLFENFTNISRELFDINRKKLLRDIYKPYENENIRLRFDDCGAEFFSYSKDNIFIELKPKVGDEYPCILRKMKSQMRHTSTTKIDDCGVVRSKYKNPAFLLLIGEFEAESITREDLKKVFEQSAIIVIFMDEINIDELESIKQKIQYHEQEKQKLLAQLENIENGMIKK